MRTGVPNALTATGRARLRTGVALQGKTLQRLLANPTSLLVLAAGSADPRRHLLQTHSGISAVSCLPQHPKATITPTKAEPLSGDHLSP